jgi:hypothetical protein
MNTGSPFDYSFLAPQAAEVRGLESKSTLNMIKIGDVLQFAKDQLLKHGQFTDWIECELPISVRTAQRYIAIAKLAEGKHDTVSRLPPATVRMIAEKSTPPEIVAEVIAQADVGNILSESAVEAMLSDVRRHLRTIKRAVRTMTLDPDSRYGEVYACKFIRTTDVDGFESKTPHGFMWVHVPRAERVSFGYNLDSLQEVENTAREQATEFGAAFISRASEGRP